MKDRRIARQRWLGAATAALPLVAFRTRPSCGLEAAAD